jgi:hypothetical protein
MLEWKADKEGAIAEHERGQYRVYSEGDPVRYCVRLNDTLIGYSTSEDIALDMAEEHAEFGFWAFPPRRRSNE